MAVSGLVVLLLARLGLGAAWRYRKAFRVRDGAAYRIVGSHRRGIAPLRVLRKTRSNLEVEPWGVPGKSVYTLEIALVDGASLVSRYVDEAERDRDWHGLVVPASYRDSPEGA